MIVVEVKHQAMCVCVCGKNVSVLMFEVGEALRTSFIEPHDVSPTSHENCQAKNFQMFEVLSSHEGKIH